MNIRFGFHGFVVGAFFTRIFLQITVNKFIDNKLIDNLVLSVPGWLVRSIKT